MADFYNGVDEEKIINLDWKKKKVFERIKKTSEGKPKFYFLDGPPFVTNEVHPGTMLGIFMKDSIIRYKQMKGFDVRMQPGWDTQGLPIEVAVEKRLGIKNKKEIKEYGEERFINECKKFAEEYIRLNTSIMLDYGLLWYNNKPYKTYEDKYIEAVWAALKNADGMGLLYKGFKTTWFCVRCGTPMSNYEVRDKYYDKEDPSLYVLFKADDDRYLIVWTTTPWTLPSNAAIAVNSDFIYVDAEIDGKTTIIAKDRLSVLDELGIKYAVKREYSGSELIGLRYRPLFPDIPQIKENAERIGKVIDGSDFVSEEGTPFVESDAGTGLVHSAPGHGESDYKIGLDNDLPMLSPVDDEGKFTYKAGWLEGESVLKANEIIIKTLQEQGAVLAVKKVLHKYPHCWRCKTPLVQRASDQWFMNVKKIKGRLIEISKSITWIPPLSMDMFETWLSNAQDWVISRQRYWNTPLPVWECSKCDGKAVVGSKKELLSLSGEKSIKSLHKNDLDSVTIKCPKCSEPMKRVTHVVDVWLDSGSASFADLGYPAKKKDYEKWFPADFICEGNDQVRGWFYSSLVMGYLATSKLSFKNAVMHKFVIGDDGRKLSKSEGNYKSLLELQKEGYGRDALRLALLKHGLEDIVVFSTNDLSDAKKVINIIYNLRNLYTSVNKGFESKKSEKHFDMEDRWILSKWNETKKTVDEEMEKFRPDHAINSLVDFVVNDFSRTYMKLAKPRIFDEEDAAAFYVFSLVLKESSSIMSIFVPYISEYTHKALGEKGSVLLSKFPAVEESLIDPIIENRMSFTLSVVQDVLAAREKIKTPLKRPLNSILLPGVSGDQILEDILKMLTNTLHVRYELNESDFEISLNFDSLKKRYSQAQVTGITAKFIELTKGMVIRHLGKKMDVLIDSKTYELTDDDIKLIPKTADISVFDGQIRKIVLDKALNEEVRVLWIKREVVRTVQSIRKEFGMNREDIIRITLSIDGDIRSVLVSEVLNYVAGKTNATLQKEGKLLKIENLAVDKDNLVVSVFR